MLNLRKYQIDSIQSLRDGFRQGHVRQVLCASTGSGKSIIMMAMIQSALAKNSRVGFIVERRILAEQFSKHLDAHDVPHGVLMSKHYRFRPQEKVQVISAQTMEKMQAIPHFDIVFIDELHACMRSSIVNLLNTRPSMKVIGSTATPFNEKISKQFTAITNVINMSELVSQGFLVPFRVFIAHEIDTSDIKVVAGEWAQNEVESKSLQIVGDVVSDYIDISNRLYGKNAKAICFSAGIAHGKELVAKFAESGVNAVQLTCDTPDDVKVEVLKDFSRTDTDIDMLISTDILTKGFDQPDIQHVILAKPLRKSFSNFVQMVGRGARIYEGKTYCSIQDNSGNWLRFKDQWDKLYSEGVDDLPTGGEKKPKKEPTDKEKKAVTCPRCKALMASDTCAVCGYVREKKNKVETVAGEMLELSASSPKKEKYDTAYKTDFYAQAIGYCQNKGYKPGRAFFMYKDKFGVEPSMKKPDAKQPNAELFNFIKYQAIKKQKGAK